MPGYASQSDVPFISPAAASLPVTVPPVVTPGATHDYDAKRLALLAGSTVASWKDEASTTPLTASGTPTLEREVNGAPYVKFIASESDAMQVSDARPAVNTVAVVASMRTAAPYSGTMGITGSGTAGGSARNVLGFSSNGAPRVFAGVGLDLTSVVVVPGKYFVMIGVFNGAASVVNFNGVEATGNSGSEIPAALSLARWGITYTDVDIKRVVLWPFALNAAQRAAEVANFETMYRL